MIYSGKKAVVLGLGHSGEAAGLLLREEGADVTICESSDNPGLRDKSSRLRAQGIEVLLGPAADCDPSHYDICILSPGIDPSVPLVQNVLRKKIPVIGELELAFEECICPVVAITGTNGKTTTTELTTAMLQIFRGPHHCQRKHWPAVRNRCAAKQRTRRDGPRSELLPT